MIIAELIEQLSKMDLTLTVYAETDNEISPVHTVDRDQFDEGRAVLGKHEPFIVESVVLVATEESDYGPRGPRTPEVQPGVEGHDHGEARS